VNTRAPAPTPKVTLTAQQATAPTTPVAPVRVDSTTLMSGQRVLEIVHLGEVYRLQTTRFGKLILTK
jgi:hemin uptake protein HemP